MHFEILVEDSSGGKALECLIPKIIAHIQYTKKPVIEHEQHTFRLISHGGLGTIPKDLHADPDPATRTLLENLPKKLRAYGKTYPAPDSQFAVIVVCDLDDKYEKIFYNELKSILNTCNPQPKTRFCIAREEGEAWLLGDIPAVKAAYPDAKDSVLKEYSNDSICGTWEMLADAVHPDGRNAHAAQNYQAWGKEKHEWAEKITPHMTVNRNISPSFQRFRTQLRELAGEAGTDTK